MGSFADSFLVVFVALSCTAASGREPLSGSIDIPNLDDILSKAAEFLVGEYSVTDNCKAVLTTDEDECEINIAAKPERCMTLSVLAQKLLGSNSKTAQDIINALPSSVAIKEVKVDVCGEVFEITVTSTQTFNLVPGAVDLKNVTAIIKLLIPTKALHFSFIGTWKIGEINFTASVLRTDEMIVIAGKPEPASKEFNIGEIISAAGSKLTDGNRLENAVNSMGLKSLTIKDVVLEAAFTDRGFGVRFSFKGVSSALGNPHLHLTLNSMKGGSKAGISIAGSFTDLKIATLLKKITKLDISGVPFIGSTTFTTLDMITSSMYLGEPFIPYTSESLVKLSPILAGMQILTEVKFTSNGKPTKVKIIAAKSLLKFEILSNSGISVSAFIDKLISNIGIVNLPPKFKLQSFLDLTLKGFEYNPSTKIFTLPVDLPEPIIFVPNAIELDNATVLFEVRTGNPAGSSQGSGSFGINIESNWKLGKLNIPLTIRKPIHLPVFLAESRPQIDIPFGSLIEKFLVSILPSGKLKEGVKKIGFESFYITNPYVKIYFDSNMVLKVSGKAVIGAWDKCEVEVMLGQVSGSFVMATGIVLTDVPITELVKTVTDNALDLSKLPGSSILDATDVAISMSSQNVPKVQNYMQFSIPALSDVDILDGVTLMTAFKFPQECTENVCRTFKKLLGANAQLVLKGRLYLAAIYISATVPTQIQVYRGINITDVGFEVEMGVKRNAIGLKGTLQIPDPALTFIGGFGISTSGVYLQMSMAGWWNKPFGVPFFAIGNLHLRASIVPDPGLISAIEFGGQGKLGLLGNKTAKPLSVSMYCGIDRLSIQNFFQGSFSSLTLKDILAAFAYRPSLPKPLAEIGFPNGMNTSFAFKTKVLPNGITIPRGYFLKGMLKILFFRAYADVKINLNGIFVNLTIEPFKIGKSGLVEVSGRSSSMGPRIFIDVGWNPPRAFINIEGKLKVLGITAYTNITINHKGMKFEVSGSFLNLFEAGLTITSNYNSIKTADFQVDGYFTQNLFKKLETDVLDDLNGYRRKADREINSAKNKVEKAKKVFDDASNDVLNARNHVNAQKRHFDNANRNLESKKRYFLSKKRNWDIAVGKVRSARDAVTREQRKFDSAIRNLQNKQRNSCPRACRKRRAVDDEVFVKTSEAKEFIKKRSPQVKRGWFRIRIKNPIEVLRETVEKPRELAERGREFGERRVENVKCAGITVARVACIKALQVAEGAVRAARGSLDAVKFILRGAEAAVSESRRIMDVAAGLVTAAQGVVSAAKKSLDAANLALVGAAEVVKSTKYTLDAAKGASEAAKHVNRFGVDISKAVTKFTHGGIFIIKELKFSVRLSIANGGHFSGTMRARILGERKTFSFYINLMSFEDMVKALLKKIQEAMKLFRRKRIVEDLMNAGLLKMTASNR